MESIGQLAAGIAHEINTPAQYVSDNVAFLRESWAVIGRIVTVSAKIREEWRQGLPALAIRDELDRCFEGSDIEYLTSEIPRAIDETIEGARQVARIVRSMNEFAHPPGTDKCACDLNHAIENTITVARNEWKYVARLETSFDKTMPPVVCRIDEINQVMLNLIVNAAHAVGDVIADGSNGLGTIRVETEYEPGWAIIRIKDTGNGIPEEIASRIFEPFFTTKPLGKGTGQGLAIARKVIVDNHHGKISVENNPGPGACFVLRLPVNLELET
jgi:signal transduction histidine kinase